jgi:predicted enzyme involved in methoxymalonyl-ACP biosynthesis
VIANSHIPTENETVVLASSFYTAALERPMKAALAKRGRECDVTLAPYNQLFSFLLDPKQIIEEDRPVNVILLFRAEDLIRFELTKGVSDANLEAVQSTFLQRIAEFCDVLDRMRRMQIIVLLCPSGRGAYDVSLPASTIRVAEHRILATLRRQQRHHILTWPELGSVFNPAGDRLGHVPFSPAGLQAIAEFLVRQLQQIPARRLESGSAALPNLRDFVRTLEVRATITPLRDTDREPLVDLARHTTHFINLPGAWNNLSLSAAGNEGLVMRIQDRFGDYGLSGAVLSEVLADTLRIKLMFLSCPVLGKQVEYALMAWLGEEALSRGAAYIEIPFVQGADNGWLQRFLTRLAGEDLSQPKSFRLRAGGLADRSLAEAPDRETASAILSRAAEVAIQ